MSENFAIDAINPNLHVGSGVGISRQTNAIKNNNIFNAFFDSAEKCQMALDVLKNGKLGNVQKYTDVIKELENKIKTQYNHADFDVQKRIELRKGWEYVEKELKLALDSDVQTKKDKLTVTDVWYERVLKNATSAEKCQIIIDKILDTGSYSHFDTPEEVKKLVVLLEEKKATFENAASVESSQWREEMKAARALNKFATKKLFEEGRKLSDKVEAECEALSPWEYSGMWWEAKFTGKEDPYAQITSKYTDFIDAVCELSNDVDSLTMSEFGDKATKLLGTEKYDVALVKKLAKGQNDYTSALTIKKIEDLLALDVSQENLSELETVLGGAKAIEEKIQGYQSLSLEEKFQEFKKQLNSNKLDLQKTLNGQEVADVLAAYETDYSEFLKMVGVENINEELDSFRSKAEILGMCTKIVFVAGASVACAITAGGAVGLLGAAVKGSAVSAGVIKGTATVAGALGSFSASSLPELYARDGELKNDIVQQYIDNPDILAHSAIDGVAGGSATGVSMLIGGAVKNIGAKYLSLLFADGLIGVGATYAHAKQDGREITGKDIGMNFGIAAITSGFGARAGAKIQTSKVSAKTSVKGEVITNKLYAGEPKLAPMYRNNPVAVANTQISKEIRMATHPVYPDKMKYLYVNDGEYVISKSIAQKLNDMKEGDIIKLVSRNDEMVIGDLIDIYGDGFALTKENGKLVVAFFD